MHVGQNLRWIAQMFSALTIFAAAPVSADQRVRVTGEIIDTWCYLSGVMGGPESVVGTAHHTCAVWCAAGGIPVGLLGNDGKLYMVLKLEGGGTAAGGERVLSIQAHVVTADGQHYERDGLNYLIVDKIVGDAGITSRTHESFGVVPPNALPETVIERLKRQ